jgi:hypothetical protein
MEIAEVGDKREERAHRSGADTTDAILKDQSGALAYAHYLQQIGNLMFANVGAIDRVLRTVVGLPLIAAAFGLFGAAYQTVWGWIGLIPLATGLAGWCPLCTAFGVKTCRSKAAVKAIGIRA